MSLLAILGFLAFMGIVAFVVVVLDTSNAGYIDQAEDETLEDDPT